MPPTSINSITLFTDFLEKLRKNIVTDKDHEYYFRGHTESIEEILPKIYRINKEERIVNLVIGKGKPLRKAKITSEKALIKNEDKIFKEIILRAPQDFINENTAVERLVKMQHYGLPTRLLDITSNPLVALYFACQKIEGSKKDGEIIILKIPKNEIRFYDSDTVGILSNLARMKPDFVFPDDELLLLHEIRKDIPAFSEGIQQEDIN